jgi:hypothetical protein
MRIFDRIPKTTRASVIETAVGVGATLGISALCGVPNLGLQAIAPHPVWLVVLVIAARYGTRGLGVALPIAWGSLAVMSGAGGPGRVLDTLAMPMELGALAGAVLVGWIASGNEHRERGMARKTAELERRVTADAATIADLRRAALVLRARNDRLDLSLTFLRNVARRLHGPDPEAAAQAVLELITARIGARAASIEMSELSAEMAAAMAGEGSAGESAGELAAGGRLRPLAVVGVWNSEGPDRTARAAMSGGQPMRAVELSEGGPTDSDIAAPIVDSSGVVRGVVAARGVPGGGASMAALRDLSVIADWAGPALCALPPGRKDEGDEDEPSRELESDFSSANG